MFKTLWRKLRSRAGLKSGVVRGKQFDAARTYHPDPAKRPFDAVTLAPVFWLKIEHDGRSSTIHVTEQEWDSVQIGDWFPKEEGK